MIAFADDGRTVTVRGSTAIAIYEVETGHELYRAHAGRVTTFRNRIAGARSYGGAAVVFVVDRATNRAVEADPGKILVTQLRFSPGGRWLLIESGGTILVCDTFDPTLPIVRKIEIMREKTDPVPGGFSGSKGGFRGGRLADTIDVANSPDDRLVGTAQNGLGKVVGSEAGSGREVVTIHAAHPDIANAAFSPDGRRLLTTSRTRPGRTSPTQAAIRAERQLRLQEALNGMDSLDREILALRHFEELSNSEAATVLELTKTAASNRYIRALKRLKEILSALPGIDPNASAG